MSIDNNQDFFTFELEYKVTNEDKIKLFGIHFVNKNKDKCKIIYNGEEFELTTNFEVENNHINNEPLKIQLKIKKNITDLSYLFCGCKNLLSFKSLSKINDLNFTKDNNSMSMYNSIGYTEKFKYLDDTEKNEIIYDDNLMQSSIS